MLNNEINPLIFRAYDIRGSSLKDLTEQLAYRIGYILARNNIISENRNIYVGRDGRLSSPLLYKGLVNGLVEGGAQVISVGIVPSPLLYFVDKIESPALSIIITGSHNSKDDNGFKIVKNGESLAGEKLKNLYNDIIKNQWPEKIDDKSSKIQIKSYDEQYIQKLLENIDISNSLKIVWDPGNGASCNILKSLLQKLPNQNIIINSEIDGNFPNHHPDPTEIKNLQQLTDKVIQEKFDLGIAFDGDGDRIGIITKLGKVIWGDQMLCIFGESILKTFPKANIIADVKSSEIFFDYIKKLGGNPIMSKTGHSFIKLKLKNTKALLAGEMSGHIFFADKYYGFDDAIYAALRFLEILSQQSLDADELLSNLPLMFNSPEIRIEVIDSLKFTIIAQLKEILISRGEKFNDLDGIRYKNSYGWWLVRASNTQNALIVRYEASDKKSLNLIKYNLEQLLHEVDIKLPSNE